MLFCWWIKITVIPVKPFSAGVGGVFDRYQPFPTSCQMATEVTDQHQGWRFYGGVWGWVLGMCQSDIHVNGRHFFVCYYNQDGIKFNFLYHTCLIDLSQSRLLTLRIHHSHLSLSHRSIFGSTPFKLLCLRCSRSLLMLWREEKGWSAAGCEHKIAQYIINPITWLTH